jgi:hypothetical protein
MPRGQGGTDDVVDVDRPKRPGVDRLPTIVAHDKHGSVRKPKGILRCRLLRRRPRAVVATGALDIGLVERNVINKHLPALDSDRVARECNDTLDE